jgi:hypothetical protein
MCGAGDAVKLVTCVLNCQLFRTKVQLFTQNPLPRHAHIKQQTTKTKSFPTPPAMATLILTQHNNQPTIRGTSLTSKMIANSPYDFITVVDCYLALHFSQI